MKRSATRRCSRWSLPVVAETYDGALNDINGFHVKPEHVFAALDGARGGPVAEGNVGGGTGMVCYGFKGGIGTASRVLGRARAATRSACWCRRTSARRRELRVAGVPVGQEIPRRRRAYGGIADDPATTASLAPSSSSSRPTRRCCRTS